MYHAQVWSYLLGWYKLVYHAQVWPYLLGWYKLVYHAQVWPYLLGWYKFGSTEAERTEQDAAARRQYENVVSEWLVVEAIVRQQVVYRSRI